MTIAGSDSGGGAGIEADLRSFAAYRVHGTVAITAVTAQNTSAVTAVCPLEPEMVVAQIETVTADIRVDATKTGMLARPATVEAVGELAAAGKLAQLVVDPVLVSSTGHPLMEDGGAAAYREALLPFALIVTPNLREAAVLVGTEVDALVSIDAMADAARALLSLGATWVVVKGGHLVPDGITESMAPDIMVGPEGSFELAAPRIDTRNDHGTGCSLAAATAAQLALGASPLDAVREAKAFVHAALRGARSWTIGNGHGPIDHLGWSEADDGEMPLLP